MDKENILESIGLTGWESQAYTSLLELGETTTGPLVKKSGIPQSKIYHVLEMLQKKGLVNHLKKNNIKHYQASPPERVMAFFREKEKELKKNLDSLSINTSDNTSVELFEGFKAIRTAHASMIEDAKLKEILYGYSRGDSYSDETNEFYHWWGERKRYAKLIDQLLIYEGVKKEFEASIKKEQLNYVKSKTRYTKLMLPTDTLIFRNTIIFYHWLAEPQAIIIHSEEISKRYKEFFNQLWDKI